MLHDRDLGSEIRVHKAAEINQLHTFPIIILRLQIFIQNQDPPNSLSLHLINHRLAAVKRHIKVAFVLCRLPDQVLS